MANLFAALTTWLMRRRSSLPRWMNRAMESVARNPDGFLGRLAGRLLRGPDTAPTTVPSAPVRLYIAPTNYSGQGRAWARAVEREYAGTAARNMAVALPGDFGFPADTLVPIATVNSSAAWADAEWQAARSFTHVLVEAQRSMFGRRFGRDLAAEITALESAGVAVAHMCHGTDIRDPDAHAARTRWSPYPEDPRTAALRADAVANLALLTAKRLPTFVSTPDLIDDVPWARWCPVVIDPAAFRADRAVFSDPTNRIVHVSTSAVQKGTALIEPTVSAFAASGAADFRVIDSAPASQMSRVYADADIVLDQFRLGSYGVAACEAMAAGRVVVGHVLPAVRQRVLDATGYELPIVEATPDTLGDVLTELTDDIPRARRIAAAGPEFVAAVHDGRASAHALVEHWIGAD